MLQHVKEKAVHVLRNTPEEQHCFGSYRQGDCQYCGMGLIYNALGIKMSRTNEGDWIVEATVHEIEQLGIPYNEQTRIVFLNDIERYTFAELAHYIERFL